MGVQKIDFFSVNLVTPSCISQVGLEQKENTMAKKAKKAAKKKTKKTAKRSGCGCCR